MRLEDIAASFRIDPERERKFALEMSRNLKGSVKRNALQVGCAAILILVLSMGSFILCEAQPGIVSMMMMMISLLGGVLVLWYMLTWELTFNGETGFFSYHTLFKGTINFHVSEITDFRDSIEQYRSRFGTYLIDCISFKVDDTRIVVKVGRVGSKLFWGGGGYTNANKLKQYMELYQKCIASPETDLTMNGVDPRIAAAIAHAKIEEQMRSQHSGNTAPENAPDINVDPGISAAIVNAKMEEQVRPGKTAPENAPETTEEAADTSASEPVSDSPKVESPASEQKKEIDVDALFNNVLTQYGKSSSSGGCSSSSADLLFQSVFDKLKK